MTEAVLFCPARDAQNVAHADKGWTPIPDPSGRRMAWETREGERVEHVGGIQALCGMPRGLRIYLGYRWWTLDHHGELYALATVRGWKIIEQ